MRRLFDEVAVFPVLVLCLHYPAVPRRALAGRHKQKRPPILEAASRSGGSCYPRIGHLPSGMYSSSAGSEASGRFK